MTTHKGFKQRVRARMAKTGERYASARRAILEADGDIGRGGTARNPSGTRLYPETASLARVLADRAVVSGATGEPLTEAMILGIGGGLGAGYILWEFKARGGAILTLGFSNLWQYPDMGGWYGKTLARLGIDADEHETSGAKGARATLDGILAEGRSVVAFVDQQEIGTWGQPDSLSGYSGYPVAIIGRIAGGYLVDDRGTVPLEVDDTTMAAARARIPSFKHRLIDPRIGPSTISESTLRRAVTEGLTDQVSHLRERSDSFSLPAWRKWSRLMTDRRNAKAWPRVFDGGLGLFNALLSIVEGVDGDTGATGGHLRELYARFLEEAASLLDRPTLLDAAGRWRDAADLWEDLADAAVPADLEDGSAALASAEALHDAVMAGEPGRSAARAAATRLWAIRDRQVDDGALPDDRREALFADLGGRLGRIFEAETIALEATARAIA